MDEPDWQTLSHMSCDSELSGKASDFGEDLDEPGNWKSKEYRNLGYFKREKWKNFSKTLKSDLRVFWKTFDSSFYALFKRSQK